MAVQSWQIDVPWPEDDDALWELLKWFAQAVQSSTAADKIGAQKQRSSPASTYQQGHDFSPETVNFMRIDPQRALPCNLFCAWPLLKHHFEPEIFWLQDADGAPIIAVQRRASGVAQKSGGIPGTYCADSQQPGRLSDPSDTRC